MPDLAQVVARLGLGEVCGEEGGPRVALTAELRGGAERVGGVRHFRRGAQPPGSPEKPSKEVLELLELRLAVPLLGLSIVRIFGFAGPRSPVPHLLFGDLTTGAPGTPGASTITVDLLPRHDLMLHPAYAERIYGALAPALEAFARRSGDACDEVSMALEGPLGRRVLLSPWASRLTALAGPPGLGDDLFRVYADRWIELLSGEGAPLVGPPGAWDPEPAERDRRLRAALSETAEDPLWRELRRLCGPAQASAVQALVRGER